MGGYSLGIDIGTSSVKTALLDIASGSILDSAAAPDHEMEISSPQEGWAEQDPSYWWRNVVSSVQKLRQSNGKAFESVSSIGLSYQEHGLVLLDKSGSVIRPAIIWCDGRAVSTGERLFEAIGRERCASHLLNSPGNFTASKMAWVKEHEPEAFARAAVAFLPGDYIAYLMTGETYTTVPGLSEQVLFDYSDNRLATFVLDATGMDPALIPPVTKTFGVQGIVLPERAAELGVPSSAVVSFRAGDQHCNSFGMNVLTPGQVAIAAGTSGAIFAVTDQKVTDTAQRINTFAHVNHSPSDHRYGVVLCVNGAAISYRWLRDLFAEVGKIDYEFLNQTAARSAPTDRPVFLPFGNGPERPLGNSNVGASFTGLDFNRHNLADLVGSVLDGVVYALCNGMDILTDLGISMSESNAGYSGLFRNENVVRAFATLSGRHVRLFSADPATGAARGAAVGFGSYSTIHEALSFVAPVKTVEPDLKSASEYQAAFASWKSELAKIMHLRSLQE